LNISYNIYVKMGRVGPNFIYTKELIEIKNKVLAFMRNRLLYN